MAGTTVDDMLETGRRARPTVDDGDTRPVLALAHGAFFAAAGAWAVLSPRTFQWVTGPKRDYWLVKTVGTLIAIAGASLMVGGYRRRVTPELQIVGLGVSGALGFISFWYALRGRISRIYFLDSLAEGVVIAAWLLPESTRRRVWRRLRRHR